MKASFTCTLSSDLDEKFKIALQLNQENVDDVIEEMIMQYISTSFSRASQAYKPVPKYVDDSVGADSGKANNRIPKWALKPHQNNHKIIKAYFKVEREMGTVTLDYLEKMCSNEKNNPDTYVRDFRGNFAQMKIDSPKSHGKVFEVDNNVVNIWSAVKATLMEYRKYFEQGDNDE
ncbi:hypothetical protein [Trichococcus shcherbakoviae]|uniref:hypothetical protein n=1 Tax=Trichococcus shcherbakoviae TaxID=2094020 RepID=UPI002AA78D10|nr:hypothetical protein [Trichococcus shcherbakoviae]